MDDLTSWYKSVNFGEKTDLASVLVDTDLHPAGYSKVDDLTLWYSSTLEEIGEVRSANKGGEDLVFVLVDKKRTCVRQAILKWTT